MIAVLHVILQWILGVLVVVVGGLVVTAARIIVTRDWFIEAAFFLLMVGALIWGSTWLIWRVGAWTWGIVT